MFIGQIRYVIAIVLAVQLISWAVGGYFDFHLSNG
jgi:hypothetical protein